MAGISFYHEPVLLERITKILTDPNIGKDPVILDCTLGGGGHSEALLEAGARVIGIDRDPEAIKTATKRLAKYPKFTAIQGNYADAERIPELEGIQFTGILADLGVSSRQLDDSSRGFSFREDAPLDMRMEGRESSSSLTAPEILNSWKEDALAGIFKEYGDEAKAYRLAGQIVRRRKNRPFVTSTDLVGAIRAALGPRSAEGDFARLFQAIRIAVNDELAGLERALPALRDKLVPGGVLAVISYHSGEDRIVKHAMREWSMDCICPPKQIQCTCRGKALGEVIHRKSLSPDEEEIKRNPRARSAKLRVWRKG